MNNGRRVELDVTYNNAPFAGQVGAEIESLTYVDNAADDSDSIDITLDAQDSKWLHGWLPEEGATLRPRIIGRDWNGPGDTHVMECGLFILDDVAYQDAPTTLQVGGVSKPSDTDFSELERETIWKNTSIKRIGESIAGRYGLGFTYDADDYDIECDEQDGTDSSYYNTLCKNYGLILKVYAKRLWVYDRERYKGKRAVQDFDRTNIIPGSLSYNTTLSGTYTGGYFTYTDADKDLDIVCSVGGGNHTKNVNRRATSVYDASVQLCAEINNANHGRVKLKFSVMGNWGVSAGNNLRLTGYGDGLNGGMDDVIILGQDKETLHRWKAAVETFLQEELALDLNSKTSIRPVRQGVEFVGVRIWPTHMKLRKSTVRRIKREVRKISALYAAGDMTRQDFYRRIASIRGLLKHTESASLRWRLNEIYRAELEKAKQKQLREEAQYEPFADHSGAGNGDGNAGTGYQGHGNPACRAG